MISLRVDIELSNYLPSPNGLEEVGNIVEVDIAASAAYPVTRKENLLCISMLLGKFHHAFLVVVVYVVRGLDLDGYTAAKEEHCLIQPILYVKYPMVHNSSEFPQCNCGFSRNIRNDSANLVKFI